MKHLLDTGNVARMLAEGIHIVFKFILHVILGKGIALSFNNSQQFLVEILVAWCCFLTHDATSRYILLFCQRLELLGELLSGFVHIETDVEGGFLGCAKQTFKLSCRGVATSGCKDAVGEFRLSFSIEIAAFAHQDLIEGHGIIGTFKDEHSSGIL